MRKLKENKNKILLKVIFRLRNEEEFFKIEKNFKKNGYIIEEYGEIDKRNFKMEDLSIKIRKLKEKYGENCKIVLASNIKDVLFVGFRIYNGIIDNFIFFIDKINYSILNNEKSDYELMAEFVDIDKENIKNKIYINIEFENFMTYFDFFVKNSNFSYFENIEKFNFNNEKIYKMEISKIREENEENKFYEKLNENRYFIVFYVVGLLRKYEIKEVREMTVPLFKYFQDKKIEEKQIIAETIYTTKGIVFLKFKEKMAIFSLMVLLELSFGYLIKFIMKTLTDDNEGNEKFYPAILADLLMYMNNCIGMETYKSYQDDLKSIIKKIDEYIKSKMNINKSEKYDFNSKKIAFVVDAITNKNYSVAKITFDIVKNIKKYYPDYEVRIFIENNFSFIEEEKILLYTLIQDVPSERFLSEHREALDGLEGKLVYSSPVALKDIRVKDMSQLIIDYNPEIILTTTLCSNSINILYDYFPTLYISMVSLNYVNDFDVQLYPHLEHTKNILKQMGKEMGEGIYGFEYGADFKKSSDSIYIRNDFNIDINDFVMITVGVRLKTELSEEYIKLISKILKKYKNAKWYLVGVNELPLIQKCCPELINTQIFTIRFEEKLGALYRICDIYLNPPRDGGGFSMAEAIVNEIPVVSDIKSPSGKHYIGSENCVKGNEEYFKEIEKLMSDKFYYYQKVEAEKENLKKYEYAEVIKKLMEFVEIAKEKFQQRKKEGKS